MSNRKIEPAGKKFGTMTVLGDWKAPGRHTYQWCQCTCGAKRWVRGSSLRDLEWKGCTQCPGHARKLLEPGVMFGRWTVLDAEYEVKEDGHTYQHVQCSCDKVSLVLNTMLRRGDSTGCPNCAQLPDDVILGLGEVRCAGCKRILSKDDFYVSRTRETGRNASCIDCLAFRNARDGHGVEFGIGFFLHLRAQPCALTGRTDRIVVDRIDSSKPYSFDNVQPLHHDVNLAKLALSQEDFIALCHDVARLTPLGVEE